MLALFPFSWILAEDEQEGEPVELCVSGGENDRQNIENGWSDSLYERIEKVFKNNGDGEKKNSSYPSHKKEIECEEDYDIETL